MFSDPSVDRTRADGLHDDNPPRMACALCRRRKMRCNRQLPCDSCTRLGFECIYEAPRSHQTTKRNRMARGGGNPDLYGNSQKGSGRSSPDLRPPAPLRKTLHPTAARGEWNPDQMSKEEMAELENAYFETIHHSIKTLHHVRYSVAIISEPRLRPPRYLRYILCALGALGLPKHRSKHDALYRASRKQLEETELNDPSVEPITLARPQAWTLIAVYELLQMQFHRYWMSTARAVRLAQILGLHSVDGVRSVRRFLPAAKDWTELEEQRRTFWTIFCLDRYAAFGHGCPMIIDEKDIRTFLPVSDAAYDSCTETKTLTLNEALNARDVATLPAAAAAIVLTAETGQKLKMLQREDFSTFGTFPPGDIWQKISWLDNTLHYAFSVPPHLAASGFEHTPLLTFLHMCAPSSTILLHQAAEEQASSHGITPSSLLESQALRLAAAEMVASTMKLASNIDVRLLHPFTGVCLFSAAKVLMRSLAVRTDEGQQASVRVLLDALGSLQGWNTLAGGYFKDLDREFPGMRTALYAQQKPEQRGQGMAEVAIMTPEVIPPGLPFANGHIISLHDPDLTLPLEEEQTILHGYSVKSRADVRQNAVFFENGDRFNL